jgi:hypothetical protein
MGAKLASFSPSSENGTPRETGGHRPQVSSCPSRVIEVQAGEGDGWGDFDEQCIKTIAAEGLFNPGLGVHW